jgi:hypothetical protein
MTGQALKKTTLRAAETAPCPLSGSRQGADLSPATGLARGYLDQFSEAIALLEMLAVTPGGADSFHDFAPVTYRAYLEAIHGNRNAANAVYHSADPAARAQLERLAASMIDVLTATREAMSSMPAPAVGMLAGRAAVWLGSLLARARVAIDGDR